MICVIAYPAEWSAEQKSLIVEVADEAGFPNVVGCEEPLGVVYYHHFKGDLFPGQVCRTRFSAHLSVSFLFLKVENADFSAQYFSAANKNLFSCTDFQTPSTDG